MSTNKQLAIVRTSFHDRSAFLQLSLEYQEQIDNVSNYDTYIFIDPHPKYGYVDDYNNIIIQPYYRINWPSNNGKFYWYNSVNYIFSNTNYEYVLTIEDDIILSKDYIKLCEQIIVDKILSLENDILFFHAGAWEQPKGNRNNILKSRASTRSCLIHRDKFDYIKKHYNSTNESMILAADLELQKILDNLNMITIAPEYNRHGHFGIYGLSSCGGEAEKGQLAVFEQVKLHSDMYSLLKKSCLSKELLVELNKNKNPNYFWNFDPNINFESIQYNI